MLVPCSWNALLRSALDFLQLSFQEVLSGVVVVRTMINIFNMAQLLEQFRQYGYAVHNLVTQLIDTV